MHSWQPNSYSQHQASADPFGPRLANRQAIPAGKRDVLSEHRNYESGASAATIIDPLARAPSLSTQYHYQQPIQERRAGALLDALHAAEDRGSHAFRPAAPAAPRLDRLSELYRMLVVTFGLVMAPIYPLVAEVRTHPRNLCSSKRFASRFGFRLDSRISERKLSSLKSWPMKLRGTRVHGAAMQRWIICHGLPR